jgi:phospholipid/cholesterol/gamma-HCH transport system substrate-binding protein
VTSSARSVPGRIFALGALAAALGLIAVLVLGGCGGGKTYKLQLENGGQLVKGNQVLIGGKPVGSIKSVELANNSEAEVTFKTDRTLHEGTTAIVRATSLSGVANRYVSLSPGPNNLPEIPDGGVITADKTTSAVDLDQLFNTLDAPARKGLQDVIQGSSAAYAGVGKQANDTYRYFSPALVATDKLLQELDSDEGNLSNFLVSSSRVVTAISERRQQLAELVPNANQALGAIASENRSFDQALQNLPPALRQANTTFFNLRDALDDLDPLVATSKPATKNLAPFLKNVKPVLKKGVPVFSDLSKAVNLKGPANDLKDTVTDLPGLQSSVASAQQPAIDATQDSLPTIKFARPYIPDVLGAVTKLGQVTAFYDADGHYARVQPAQLGLFCYDNTGLSAAPCNAPSTDLKPIPAAQQFQGLDFDINKRCPGAATQPQPLLLPSNPFLDNGNLDGGNPLDTTDCDYFQVPPGP